MSEILKEYDKNLDKTKFLSSFMKYLKFLFLIVLVVGFAIYYGNMFFGKRSLDVMLGLQTKKERLIDDVEYLKKQNARLQKEYFELKDLEPELDKK